MALENNIHVLVTVHKKKTVQYVHMYIVTLYLFFTGEKLPLRVNSKQRVTSKYKPCFDNF